MTASSPIIARRAGRNNMTPRPGQIVATVFLDHVQGAGHPIELIVFGRVLSINKISLTILSWTLADPSVPQDPTDGNNVSFTILRSTVSSIEVLQPRNTAKKKREKGKWAKGK